MTNQTNQTKDIKKDTTPKTTTRKTTSPRTTTTKETPKTPREGYIFITHKGNDYEIKKENISTFNINRITTGKPEIISFNLNSTQLDIPPLFSLKEPNEDYYNYRHNLDLRKGQKDEQLIKKIFPDFKTWDEMIEENPEKFQYTQNNTIKLYQSYLFYTYIRDEKLNLLFKDKEGEYNYIRLEWKGEPLEEPKLQYTSEKTRGEKKDKSNKNKMKEKLSDISMDDLIF